MTRRTIALNTVIALFNALMLTLNLYFDQAGFAAFSAFALGVAVTVMFCDFANKRATA